MSSPEGCNQVMDFHKDFNFNLNLKPKKLP